MSEGKSISDSGHDGDRHEHADGVMVPVTALAKSIARQGASRALTPACLESRRVIHEDFVDLHPLDIFRELRTRLLLSSVVRSPVILVSGIKPGCGASFVALQWSTSVGGWNGLAGHRWIPTACWKCRWSRADRRPMSISAAGRIVISFP